MSMPPLLPLLLLPLLLAAQAPVAASSSPLGADYDWYPTLITTGPPKIEADERVASGSRTGAPPSEKLHVIYGVTAEPYIDSTQQPKQPQQQQQHDEIEQRPEQQHYYPQQPHEQQHPEQQNSHEQQEHEQQNLYEDLSHSNYDTNDYYNYYPSHYATNLVDTEPSRPPGPPAKQQISDKTWNVAAPYIKPNDNLIEDVSFNIGMILVGFTLFVLALGAVAGALTMKQTGGRALGGPDAAEVARAVLEGAAKFEQSLKEKSF